MGYTLSAHIGRRPIIETLEKLIESHGCFSGRVWDEGFEMVFDGSRFSPVEDRTTTTVSERVQMERERRSALELEEAAKPMNVVKALARGEGEDLASAFMAGGHPLVKLFGEIKATGNEATITVQSYPELKEIAFWLLMPLTAAASAMAVACIRSSSDGAEKIYHIAVAAIIGIPVLLARRILRFFSHAQRARVLLRNALQELEASEDAGLREIVAEGFHRDLHHIQSVERARERALLWLAAAIVAIAIFGSIANVGRRMAF